MVAAHLVSGLVSRIPPPLRLDPIAAPAPARSWHSSCCDIVLQIRKLSEEFITHAPVLYSQKTVQEFARESQLICATPAIQSVDVFDILRPVEAKVQSQSMPEVLGQDVVLTQYQSFSKSGPKNLGAHISRDLFNRTGRGRRMGDTQGLAYHGKKSTSGSCEKLRCDGLKVDGS